METIVSGMRPTGNLHLGSYFGALKNFIRLQEEHNCYFFIADYHSLTTHPNPKDLHNNVKLAFARGECRESDADRAREFAVTMGAEDVIAAMRKGAPESISWSRRVLLI